MKSDRLFKFPILFIVILFLSGCAHAVSNEMRQKARKDLAFATVLANPEVHRGEVVMWGGTIIETTNREGSTMIKVLQSPLDRYGFPMEEERTQGRFLVRVTGYADPEVYKKGRVITMAGEIAGAEEEPLGEIRYTYPVVQAREVHLWKDAAGAYPPYPRPYWYWDWFGGYPYPYSYPWPYHGHRYFRFP